jgi:phenazine biosynthesis protein
MSMNNSDLNRRKFLRMGSLALVSPLVMKAFNLVPTRSAFAAFTPLFSDNRELRMKNRATVEKYLSMKGQERVDRWKLYTDDCKNFTDGFYSEGGGDAAVFGEGGIEFQKKMELMNAQNFPDWQFFNNIIFETEDPNYILAEGDGKGISKATNPPTSHSDHYVHVFRLVDGKIKNYTEVRNELGESREQGWKPDLPVIKNFEDMYESITKKDEPYIVSGKDDQAARKMNLETVKRYFSCSGKDCADRWKLFSENGSSGPAYTADGRILRSNGIEKIKAAEAVRAECFPDWVYSGLIVHQVTDPDYFLTEVMGKGVCVGYAEKPFNYVEHFYHTFRMEKGKIKHVREYYDPKRFMTLMGVDLNLPKMPS